MAKKTPTSAPSAGREQKKTECPIDRDRFMANAKILNVALGDQILNLDPKQFSTGSFGWSGNARIVIEVDGVQVKFQAGINITAVGSKPPKEA